MALHDLSFVEDEIEIFNDLTVIDKGLRGVDDAFRFAFHWGGEAFFAWDIRLIDGAIRSELSATEENHARNEADRQIGAVFAEIMKFPQMHIVEGFAAIFQINFVLGPILFAFAIACSRSV